ncbi:hypothetical protein [Parasphingorhabdus sp.]|uniref:hypothetical protein n=1 Tax=Parasphingorhabdus sp. TaxID=2709688 RepID=UPI00326420D3
MKQRWSNKHESGRVDFIQGNSIKLLEDRYDILIPGTFKSYLQTTAPMPHQDSVDDDFVDWWSADRIKNIPEEYDGEISHEQIAKHSGKYLFFADYCIWSWAWAICCQSGSDYGKIAVIGGKDRFVADNFDKFVELSLTDIDALN